MLQILYSSGGLFATKMGLKTPFEIRIVTKFSTFYGMYRHFPHKFTHFFVVTDVFALLTFFSEKAQHNFIKTRGGGGSTAVYKTYKKTDVFFRKTSLTITPFQKCLLLKNYLINFQKHC